MFSLPHNTVAYLYRTPIDIRYDMFRLQGVIADMLQRPMPKDRFYFFINRSHTLLKGIWFDGTGQCLFCKRLEKGRFSWPQSAGDDDEKWLHLPFYRQINEFERLGLIGLTESVLCNWVRAAATKLEHLWLVMHNLMLGSEALHVDETPVRCLKGTVHNGTMWAMTSADDGMALYHWKMSRGKNVLYTLLREGMQEQGAVYSGTVISDGYEGYTAWRRDLPEHERPAWQACWAHVRRKFVEGARRGCRQRMLAGGGEKPLLLAFQCFKALLQGAHTRLLHSRYNELEQAAPLPHRCAADFALRSGRSAAPLFPCTPALPMLESSANCKKNSIIFCTGAFLVPA